METLGTRADRNEPAFRANDDKVPAWFLRIGTRGIFRAVYLDLDHLGAALGVSFFCFQVRLVPLNAGGSCGKTVE